jgi:hypothetical protein
MLLAQHMLLHLYLLLLLLLLVNEACNCIHILWLRAACQAGGSHSDAAWHAACAARHAISTGGFMQLLQIVFLLLLLLLLFVPGVLCICSRAT